VRRPPGGGKPARRRKWSQRYCGKAGRGRRWGCIVALLGQFGPELGAVKNFWAKIQGSIQTEFKAPCLGFTTTFRIQQNIRVVCLDFTMPGNDVKKIDIRVRSFRSK
jgi:hypothetical protein